MEFLTETLLEMHYHRALVGLFESAFGKRFLRMIKPSTNKEVFLGFDQGWVRTEIDASGFLDDLRGRERDKAAKNALDGIAKGLQSAVAEGRGRGVQGLYFGYFLQFKCVQQMTRITGDAKKIPGLSRPYFRVELALKPNASTGISQHETLLRLSKIDRTDVNYACPMIFELEEIWEEPDLGKLRIVPVASAPPGYATNERHYIVFATPDDGSPKWISDPVDGAARSPAEWVVGIQAADRRLLDAHALLEWLAAVYSALHELGEGPTLPTSLTILEFET